MTTSEKRNAPPAAKFGDGAVKVAVWANPGKDDKTFYTVTLSRTFKDQDGNYKDTNSFRQTDIPLLTKFLDQAYTAIDELQKQPGAAS